MFPIFRKSKDLKNYYKIINEKEFFHLKIIGSKIRKYHFTVDKYPEIIMIKEMIECNIEFYVLCEESEYLEKEIQVNT